MVTGAALATINRLPVLLLPGDVFATRAAGTVLQELEDPTSYSVSVNDTLRPVSRFWDRVERPEQLAPALLAAMRVLTDPADTGAVTLALPQDVQAEAQAGKGSLPYNHACAVGAIGARVQRAEPAGSYATPDAARGGAPGKCPVQVSRNSAWVRRARGRTSAGSV